MTANLAIQSRKPGRRLLRRSQQVWLASLVVGLVAAWAAIRIQGVDAASGRQWLARVSGAVYDYAFTRILRSAASVVERRIIVVSIDEHTRQHLDEQGRATGGEIPRKVHAELVDRLRELGARVIVFDIVFRPESKDDRVLRAAMRRHGKVVVGARPAEVVRTTGANADVLRPGEPSVPDIRDAGFTGIVTLPEDADRSIRRFAWYAPALNDDAEYERQPSLAVTAAALYLSQLPHAALAAVDSGRFCGRPIVTFFPQEMSRQAPGETTLPPELLTPRPNSYINYVGASGRGFKTFAYEDILEWRQDAAIGRSDYGSIRNSLVLIGDTSDLSHDMHKSPLWSEATRTDEMPGVQIQANVASTILSGRYVHPASERTQLWLLVWVCLLTALVTRRLHSLAAFGVTLGLLLALLGGVVTAMQTWRFWIDPVRAAVGLVIAYALEMVLLQLTERRQQREMLGTFGRLVGPAVRDDLLREDRLPETRGELLPVTLLFSDLQGFTTLSEGMKAPDIVNLLNDYFEVMLTIIDRNGGVVDKLMGDGIMAYFGAPKPAPDHAVRAVTCALEMQGAMEPFREAAQRRGLPPLHMRIGVHTGEAVTGEIGSRERRDYTVIGDIVNVASRLEGMNKEFGTTILISEETYRASGSKTPAEFIGEATVRGRKRPVRVYAIGPRKDTRTQED